MLYCVNMCFNNNTSVQHTTIQKYIGYGNTCFFSLPIHSSSEDQGEGDLVHQRRHQDRPGDQEQDHLQAERRDGAGPAAHRAVAPRRPAVRVRRDERHPRRLPGDGPEDGGRTPGHHLAEALAAGSAGVQEDRPQHSQAAVLDRKKEKKFKQTERYMMLVSVFCSLI